MGRIKKMANIKPFKGYRYNKEKIQKIENVMAPPYDFVSHNQGAEFYERSPYNAIRLVSSKLLHESETDPHQRAADFLADCIKYEILKQDERDAIYLYEQKVIINDEPFSSRGFISLLEVTDYENGIVVPCENPSTNSKLDRFDMVKKLQANGSMISFKYIDNGKTLSKIMTEVAETEPMMDFETVDNIHQRLWQITDDKTIEIIVSEFKNKLTYLIDGHNRYEAYCDYKRFMQLNDPDYSPDKPYNYTLALLTESKDDGMMQRPVHRLVKFPKGFREDFVIAAAQDHFKIEKIIVDSFDDSLAETIKKQIATQRKEIKIALYCGGEYFYRLTYKNDGEMEKLFPDSSDTYRSLDLVVLNKLILEDVCNISEESGDERVFYTTSLNEGIEAVKNGEYGCMFAVNPVRKNQMTDIILSDELLPKRSLSVFPKPVTGIVIHKF